MIRLTSVLLLVSVTAADDVRDHFVQALRLARENRPAESRAQYRAVLRLDPDHRAARRVVARDAREHVRDALALTWHRDAARRRTGVRDLAAIAGREGTRGLLVAIRNRRLDVRLPAIRALGARGDKSAIRLLRMRLAGGTGQSAYIAQTRQIVYIQDFDVEIA